MKIMNLKLDGGKWGWRAGDSFLMPRRRGAKAQNIEGENLISFPERWFWGRRVGGTAIVYCIFRYFSVFLFLVRPVSGSGGTSGGRYCCPFGVGYQRGEPQTRSGRNGILREVTQRTVAGWQSFVAAPEMVTRRWVFPCFPTDSQECGAAGRTQRRRIPADSGTFRQRNRRLRAKARNWAAVFTTFWQWRRAVFGGGRANRCFLKLSIVNGFRYRKLWRSFHIKPAAAPANS